MVTQVVDATKEDATPRMYRSNLELRPHNDITAMISLACWNPALTGGMSVLVSGVTVHDEIKKRAPICWSRSIAATIITAWAKRGRMKRR